MTSAACPAIRVMDVTKRYGRRAVIDHLSFSLEPGTIVALLGGNGAGKTTVLKCILGITPFTGAIEVGGLSVERRGRDARRLIGYVPQLPALNEQDRCAQSLSFIAQLRNVPQARVVEALETVNLADHSDYRVGELSGGMRQRLALAAALLGEPEILLLDEPTASLDAESRAHFERIVRELRDDGKTVLLSTHTHSSLYELVDQVVILDDGALAFDGRTDELAAQLRLNNYVVNLNGDSSASFLRALQEAGIGEDRVSPAPVPWEDVLRAITARKQS